MSERVDVGNAMKRAFALGHTYWQQVDSEYASHWKKGDATKAVFDALSDETCAAVAELVEAAKEYRELPTVNAAERLDAALARVGGAR